MSDYGHGDALAVVKWAATLVPRDAAERLAAALLADPEPTTCPNCNGYGVLPCGPFGEEPECRVCRGSGEVYETEEEDGD